jgi:WD40 repeat protein
MHQHAMVLTFALLLAFVPGLCAQELKERATFKGEFRVMTVSPDGKMVATGGRKGREAQVKLWEVASGKEITTFVFPGPDLQALAFSADGRLVAAGGYGSVMAWDVTARKQLPTIKGRINSVYTLAFSPDNKKLGAAGSKQVCVWDVNSGKELASFQRRISGYAAFSTDLGTLASANYQEIDLWDVKTGKQRATLSEHRGGVASVQFSLDGKTLVAASLLSRRTKTMGDIRLWDVATGEERAVFRKGIVYPRLARLSPDGKTLAALDAGSLKLLDVATGKQCIVRPAPGHWLDSLTFIADGRLFFIGSPTPSDRETIKLWEVSLPKSKGK